jgi:hypothetical protein
MDDASTSATLLLERPERSVDIAPRPFACVAGSTTSGDPAPPSPTGDPSGLGDMLRAPGLVLLATVFLIEGYSWLGVLQFRRSSAGSLLSGSAGLALFSLLAPLAAVALARGRRAGGRALEDLVLAVAVAVTIATITALVVGGPVWRAVAGTTDLFLAASVIGAVILGERARLRSSDARTDRSSAAA